MGMVLDCVSECIHKLKNYYESPIIANILEQEISLAGNIKDLETAISFIIDKINEYIEKNILLLSMNNSESSKDTTVDFIIGKYIGQIKDSKLNGKGILYIMGKIIYEGEFKDNKLNGKGTLYENSIKLEGEIQGNLLMEN